MNSWQLFLTINRGKAEWRKSSVGKILAISFVALLFLGIAVVEYYAFNRFLNILSETPDIKNVILSYTLHSVYLLIFALMIASILISGPFIYLNKKDINLLLPLPIRDLTLYTAHFYRQVLMSIWIALIFGLPIIFALSTMEHSVLFLLEGLVFLIFLIIIAVTLGNCLLLLVFSLTRKLSSKVNYLVIFLILILLGYLISQTLTPRDIFTLLAAQNPEGNQLALSNLTSHFRFWPSGWYANILLTDLNIISQDLMSRLLLLVLAIFFIFVQLVIAWSVYRSVLQRSLESETRIESKKTYLLRFKGIWLYIFKDWLSIIRQRKDLGQFIFFIFLLAIYISFIFNVPAIGGSLDKIWTPRIISSIIAVFCYFIILLALRFVFPLPSLEKDLSWYLLSLPLLRIRNFSARILAFFMPFVIIIEAMIVITSFAFGLSASFYLPLMLVVPFIILSIISMSLCFGSVFPVKEKAEPESISTTPSGLALFVMVSIYALLVVWGLFYEAKIAVSGDIVGINLGVMYWLIILGSIILTFLFWKIGQDKYKVMDQE